MNPSRLLKQQQSFACRLEKAEKTLTLTMDMNELVAFLLLCLLGRVQSESVVVKCKSGALTGSLGNSRDGREFVSFTGVPYAKAPVNELRFANPVPVGEWEGMYDATRPAPLCVQTKWAQLPPVVYGKEDCLYLNVFRPKGSQVNLPVVVSIYGGGYSGGGIKFKDYVTYWMDEDVVFVEMNYRVGLLGFMSLADAVIPGNFGLKDQALALNWVTENVEHFGGDPRAITLLGSSVGADSAHHLALAPSTKDKIRGAVLLSGSVHQAQGLFDLDVAKNRSLNAANFLGCNQTTSREILTCLRQLDANLLPLTNQLYPLSVPFAPVIEPNTPGAFLTQNPRNFNSKTPLIIAFSNGESSILTSRLLEGLGIDRFLQTPNIYSENLLMLNLTWSDPFNRKLHDDIFSRYFPENLPPRTVVERFGLLFEESSFIFPSIELVKRHIGPRYFARFECNAQDTTKAATHGAGHPFLFNSTSMNSHSRGYSLSKNLIKMIVNFANFQNPTPEGAVLTWKPWPETKLLRITCDSTLEGNPKLVEDLEGIYRFWKDIYSRWQQRRRGESAEQ